MSPSFLDRFRNEREVGIPRRFSIGAAFVLLTIYCVLFRGLVLLGADPAWTGLICVFVGVVTIAQMALFRGARPRAASIVSGTLAAPALFVLVMLDETFTRWLGIRPIAYGFGTFEQIIPVFFMLFAIGFAGGYLVGVALAGVFYVLQKVRPSTVPPVVALDEPESTNAFMDRFSGLYSSIGRILNPAPKGTPLRGAIAMFEINLLLGFLFAPFITFLVPSQVWFYCALVGLVLAFWIGSCELRFYWPILLAFLGYFLAPWILEEVVKIPSFHNTVTEGNGINPSSAQHFLKFICNTVCVTTGISLAALIGWLQWLMLRKSEKVRFSHLVLVGAGLLMVGLAFLARNRIQAFAQTPKQQFISKVIANGDHYSIDFSLRLTYLDLNDGFNDEDIVLAMPDVIDGASIGLSSNQFTDKTVAALDGKSFASFRLGDTSNSDDAFAGLKNGFSAQYLSFHDRHVSSELLAGMLKDPKMNTMLESVAFYSANDLSTLDMSPMRTCKSLRHLYCYSTDMRDFDFKTLRGLKSLQQITFSSCSLDDEHIERLAQSLPRKLQQLNLQANFVSDAGLLKLSKLTQLKWVNVELNKGITAEGVAAFERANPKCDVRWTED